MKYCFIINPVAGSRDSSKELIPEIHRAAMVCGIQENDYSIHLTDHPAHARELAAEAARAAAKDGESVYIYAAGGDGTFNEALTGAMSFENAAVGMLPYGSGNDFLRNFGTREEFCDLEDQLRGHTMKIDMIRTQRGYAASICSAGLDAKVAYGIPKFRRLPFCGGETAYKLSILQVLLGPKATRCHIRVDDMEFDRDCLLIAVCNGHAYGGGFLAAPEAKLNDGILDVMVVNSMSLTRIAQVLPVYQAGRHFKDGQIVPEYRDVVEHFPARSVEVRTVRPGQSIIVNVDGECGPDTGLTAEAVPQSARIVLPAKVYARQK